jgi:hypothetical protein
MKKYFLITSLSVVIALTNFSFQTANSNTVFSNLPSSKTSISGLWTGTYAVDGQPRLGEQYYSFILKPDGTMIVDSKFNKEQYLSTGTWTLNNTTLTCTFTCVSGAPSSIGISQSCTAEWDNANQLIGTWRNFPPLTGTGKVLLTRVN